MGVPVSKPQKKGVLEKVSRDASFMSCAPTFWSLHVQRF